MILYDKRLPSMPTKEISVNFQTRMLEMPTVIVEIQTYFENLEHNSIADEPYLWCLEDTGKSLVFVG